MKLIRACEAWNTSRFEEILKEELSLMGPDALQLHRATSNGGLIEKQGLQFHLLNSDADADTLYISLQVFFDETIINCGCGDDPYAVPGVCTLQLEIRRSDADAQITSITPQHV